MKQTITTDDMTGAQTETAEVKITVGDVTGTLDLSAESLAALTALVNGNGADALREILTPAKSAKSGTSGPSKTPVAGTNVVPSVIREWATANKWTYPKGHANAGKSAPATGKLPPELISAYIAANPASKSTDAGAK
jgi:hypothetical protein